jgi:hypothetical protein
MMIADTYRDRITLQQVSWTDDTGFGQDVSTPPWAAVLPLKCRVVQLSGNVAVDVYGREAHEEVYRVFVDDRIPTTDSERSLHRLLRKPSETRFRFLWQGNRTMTPIGMRYPAAGTSDHHAQRMWIDCLETPEGVGYVDL